MEVGILLLSHAGIAEAIRAAALGILHAHDLRIEAVSVPLTDDLSRYRHEVQAAVSELDQGAGVLVLTDVLGASPGNLALALVGERVRVVAGLNLPMLLKILRQRSLPLDQLAQQAVAGGHSGIEAYTP